MLPECVVPTGGRTHEGGAMNHAMPIGYDERRQHDRPDESRRRSDRTNFRLVGAPEDDTVTTSTLGGCSVVARRALFELLSDSGGVTLVSAPAGSGKSVLLRSWLGASGLRDRAGWVSVERDERDAQRFWVPMIEGLRTAVGTDEFVERVAPTPG